MSKNFELLQRFGFDAATSAAKAPSSRRVHQDLPRQSVAAQSVSREESARLIEQLFLLTARNTRRSLLFAGCGEEIGSGAICLLVAQALRIAVSGSTCIVDANFRSPSLSNLLGVRSPYGLANALTQDVPIRSFATALETARDMWLIPSGIVNSDSPALLHGGRMKERLDELRAEFDYVLIDSPSLTRYDDATAWGRFTDGLVLVLGTDSTREATLGVMNSLRLAQIDVIGAVINKRTPTLADPFRHKL